VNAAGGDKTLDRNGRRVMFGIYEDTQTVIEGISLDAGKVIPVEFSAGKSSQFWEPLFCVCRVRPERSAQV
jgi:hypothetical protein